jgi:uncharacterized protein (DUF1800 family)
MASPYKLENKEHHYVSRFTYGYSPKAAKQLKKKGGGQAWFESQLKPKKVKDKKADQLISWYPSLKYSPTALVKRDRDGVQGGYEVMQDLGRWTMMRRIHSNRQLHEIMVEFWSNLLHVPIETDDAWMFRVSYDQMIRKYALKRFDKMLYAATTHGAMGMFLDNASSTKDAPNENLGREVLELHSVGVGNYTEKHVKDSARLLTGYRVDLYPDLFQRYETADHATGRVTIMGFTHANTSADGRAATQDYLKYLARHKKTSKRIAKRLCIRFVTDEPSKDLVKTVAKAYRKNKTKIKPTLLAMINHPDFKKSKREKIKTPMEDTMGTLRALRPQIAKPRDAEKFGNDFGNSVLWVARSNGQSPYDWPGPDGYPESNPPWSSTGRVLNSMSFHRGMAAGWYGDSGLVYREYTDWIPKLPASFKKVVNKISVDLHGRKAPKNVRKAISIRTGIKGSASVSTEQMTEIVVQQILLTLLDSPNHLKR